MHLHNDLYVLPITFDRDGQPSTLNPSLIVDPDGATLVDTGLPGMFEPLSAAITATGTALASLKQIILTHQDLDHVGSLPDFVATCGATVLAHPIEEPYIDGRSEPLRLSDAKTSAYTATDRGLPCTGGIPMHEVADHPANPMRRPMLC